MAEPASYIGGVVAPGKTCVLIYDTIDSSRHYGIDYERLAGKFVVERVRLLCWGDAVGISDMQAQAGTVPVGPHAMQLHVQFEREEVRRTVLHVLGCIQQIFDDTEQLQSKYGLNDMSSTTSTIATLSLSDGQESVPAQGQSLLTGVFKGAYDRLRHVAGERQEKSSVVRRAKWVIRDRKVFEDFVSELRGYNDSLERLFPGVIVMAMRAEIDQSVGVQQLQLLQEPAAEEHHEISECAIMRLVELGATVSARTELLSVSRNDDDSSSQATARAIEAARPLLQVEGGNRLDRGPAPVLSEQPGPDELEERLEEMELYMDKKRFGALSLSLSGPYGTLSRITGHVDWQGHDNDSSFKHWNDADKGYFADLATSSSVGISLAKEDSKNLLESGTSCARLSLLPS